MDNLIAYCGLDCAGCTIAGQHINYCENLCKIRICAMSKKVDNYAYCEDYLCETLNNFLKQVPEAKDRFNKIAQKISGAK